LAWFIKFMEAYPTAQLELRTALREVLPCGLGEQPSIRDILDKDIPYLDAAIEENLRLAGTSKGNMRQAVVDTEILGYKISKGTDILFNYHVNEAPIPVEETKRSASSQAAAIRFGNGINGAAGRDFDKFEPRRWLKRDEKSGKDVFDPTTIPSLAFGGGYRGCFGELFLLSISAPSLVLLANSLYLRAQTCGHGDPSRDCHPYTQLRVSTSTYRSN
jgi:hypothetical protein